MSTNLGSLIEFVVEDTSRDISSLAWPPDSFGLAAYLIKKMGRYVDAVNTWPPTDFCPNQLNWEKDIKELARTWRQDCLKGSMPSQVRTWWEIVYARYDDKVEDIICDSTLIEALLQLISTSDEASNAVGPNSIEDDFNLEIRRILAAEKSHGATLGKRIKVASIRVLPKFHTPQTGMTLRSLSHYLALYESGEVKPKWIFPEVEVNSNTFNILLIPYPWKISQSQFSSITSKSHSLANMHLNKYGFFSYSPVEDLNILKNIKALVGKARKEHGEVHGLVFPELSLTESMRDQVMDYACKQGMFFIAGVAGKSDNQQSNLVSIGIPQEVGEQANVPMYTHDIQYKHHRWQLEKNQILQYGLGSRLNPSLKLWESFSIGNRDLLFITINKHLTICVLICEDLAKQDPVAALIRAIGPNLVISLLMDAPQLSSRWPGRYATVLAEDPGSSVLTMTSTGMIKLSKPKSGDSSKSVALWKDPFVGVEHLEVPDLEKKSAILLSINRIAMEEHTADGRSDEFGTSGIAYAGHHIIEI